MKIITKIIEEIKKITNHIETHKYKFDSYKNCVYDRHNNTISLDIYTYEEAYVMLNSLENCRNTKNCRDCINCEFLYDSTDCELCFNSSCLDECLDCKFCKSSSNLSYCQDTKHSTNSTHLISCEDCHNSNNLQNQQNKEH